MGLIRPATPGFLVTLLAAVLLGVVVFSVPYVKSVFFLRASLENQGISGSVIFGTLGYCLELPNGTTCSKPSIGYSLDINALVGDSTPIQIPNVVVKWITYALVLHVVALAFAVISAVFGLLAHVREFSMTCCSTCFSGGGAAIALLAFIFDLAFFFIAKSRINAVKGGSATIGTGVWLTLAAWLLLFFAGCFFGLGRCCVSRRPRGDRGHGKEGTTPAVDNAYAEQVRMDAIRAEADRKARQGKSETGLPSFPEHERQPLTAKVSEEWMEDGDQIVPYLPGRGGAAGVGAGMAAYARQGTSPPSRSRSQQQYTAGGYAQAPAGTRAVDDYYNARPAAAAGGGAYPPQPQRQQSQPRRQASASTQYSQSSYQNNAANTPPAPVPAMPAIPTALSTNQYLGADSSSPYTGQGHSQYPTAVSQVQDYGHPERGTTYHSAASHQQYPTSYSYSQNRSPNAANETFNSEAYNAAGYMQTGTASAYPNQTSAPYAAASTPYDFYANTSPQQQYQQQQQVPERSYTLGGDNYPHTQQFSDDATLYPPATQNANHYSVSSRMTSPYSPMPSPGSPVSTAQAHARAQSMHKPQLDLPLAAAASSQHQPVYEQPVYEDSPPVYDDATARAPGEWDSKR